MIRGQRANEFGRNTQDRGPKRVLRRAGRSDVYAPGQLYKDSNISEW